MKYMKTMAMIDWPSVPNGTIFYATIKGKKVVGKINKEANGKIRLCQNKMDGKSESTNMHGFNYSWGIQYGTPQDIEKYHVKDFKLLDKAPKGFKMPLPTLTAGDYDVKFEGKKGITVGCQYITKAEVMAIAERLK